MAAVRTCRPDSAAMQGEAYSDPDEALKAVGLEE